jgi:hypothetical protein
MPLTEEIGSHKTKEVRHDFHQSDVDQQPNCAGGACRLAGYNRRANASSSSASTWSLSAQWRI